MADIEVMLTSGTTKQIGRDEANLIVKDSGALVVFYTASRERVTYAPGVWQWIREINVPKSERPGRPRPEAG